jgi:hypothetical protein
MKRSVAQILLAAGVLVIIIALAEHLFVATLIVPHLAIILGVIGVLLLAGGVYGMMSRKAGA